MKPRGFKDKLSGGALSMFPSEPTEKAGSLKYCDKAIVTDITLFLGLLGWERLPHVKHRLLEQARSYPGQP